MKKIKVSCISGGLKLVPDHCSRSIRARIAVHPCYSEEASLNFARMHLPVAPACNVQCSYCNRRYDCVNESRPGVTSRVLSPEDALSMVISVKQRLPGLRVVGIAGPGDPLANPDKTFRTFELIRDKVQDVILCLSTNGLTLIDHIDRIKELSIGHVTVTINMVNPETGKRLYKFIRLNGKRYMHEEASNILIERQLAGLKMLKEMGVLCKINSVLIPGINDKDLVEVSRMVKDLGAFIHNIIPYIPCEGSSLWAMRQRRPSVQEVKELNERCGGNMKMMRHCRQCRADAVGFLKDSNNLPQRTQRSQRKIKSVTVHSSRLTVNG